MLTAVIFYYGWLWVLPCSHNFIFFLIDMTWSLYETYQIQKSQCAKQEVWWIIKSFLWNILKINETAWLPHSLYWCRHGYLCPCLSQHHGLPHWKCVLLCCKKCPSLSISFLEKNKDAMNVCSTIHFHVYRNVSCCTMRVQRLQEYHTICSVCSTASSSVPTVKTYTRREFVFLETSIS